MNFKIISNFNDNKPQQKYFAHICLEEKSTFKEIDEAVSALIIEFNKNGLPIIRDNIEIKCSSEGEIVEVEDENIYGNSIFQEIEIKSNIIVYAEIENHNYENDYDNFTKRKEEEIKYIREYNSPEAAKQRKLNKQNLKLSKRIETINAIEKNPKALAAKIKKYGSDWKNIMYLNWSK